MGYVFADENDFMDEADRTWLNTFLGSSIPEGSIIEGMFSIVQWIDPESGERKWRNYNSLDRTTYSQLVGLLEMVKLKLYQDYLNEEEGD